MKDRRRQVIKEVRPSGNSGSIYVPREWIGHMVEIKLFSVESMVLEALFPYLESIQGIYIYGAHARGVGTPEQDIDVLVVSDRELPLAKIEGMNIEVIKADEIEEYVKADPAEYSAMVNEAVPVMNQSLLNRLKEYLPDINKAKDRDNIDKALAIAKSLEKEGDLSSAAYTLINRIRDYSVLTAIDGTYSYEGLEDFVGKRGISREKFRKLYDVYLAKKDDKPVAYNVSSADIMRLYLIVNGIRKKGDAKNEAADSSVEKADDSRNKNEPVADSVKQGEELTRENLLDKARKYKERYGSDEL